MALGCIPVVVVLLMLTATCTTEARKTTHEWIKEDRRLAAVTPPYDFGVDGHVELGISELMVWHHSGEGVHDPDVRRMGFFIARPTSQTLLEHAVSQGDCALDAENTVTLFTLDMVDMVEQQKKEEYVYNMALKDVIAEYSDLIAKYSGEFSIFFANCAVLSAVSMDVRAEVYNVKPNGRRDSFPISEDALSTM